MVVVVGEVAATAGILAPGAGLTVLALLPAALPLLPPVPLPPLLRLPPRCAGAAAVDAAAAGVAAGVSGFSDGGDTGLGGLDVCGVGERLDDDCRAPAAAAAAAASLTVVVGRPLPF